MKSIRIAVFIAFTVIIAAFAASAAVPQTFWSSFTEAPELFSTVYRISKPEQLAWVAQQTAYMVNDFRGKTVLLVADIDLSAHQWTPVGSPSFPFRGAFDGGGNTITGLTITKATGSYIGLFGYADNTTGYPSIVNCTLINATVIGGNVTDGEIYTGGFCGSGSCSDCTVLYSSITGGSSRSYTGGVGGRGRFFNCNVKETDVIGGYTSNRTSHTGGICGSGSSQSCSVINSDITGVYCTETSRTGGISGDGRCSYCTVTNTNITSVFSEYYNCTGVISGGNDTISNCEIYGSTVIGGNSTYDNSYTAGICGSGGIFTDCTVVNTTVTSGNTGHGLTYTAGIGETAHFQAAELSAQLLSAEHQPILHHMLAESAARSPRA